MITIKVDTSEIERKLNDLGKKQMPFASALALNDTANDMNDAVKDEMKISFDRPTRWTMNAFFVKRATKSRLAAVLRRKDAVERRSYLETQVHGGVRPQTGLERLLSSRLKFAGIVQSAIPARGARLDKHGNWSGGQRNQVLSAIQAQRDKRSNTTAASKKRSPRRARYFVPRPGSKLSPGVYQAMARGKVKKVLNITDSGARYRKRFHFYEETERMARHVFAGHLSTRLLKALRTAR